MRVIENVLIGGSINIRYSFPDLVFKTARYRRAERESTQKAMDILESIGLADHANDYAQNLPYGLQRRLEIARAIATDTSVLLLDEPAAGMNPQESEDLLDFIKELRDQGYTILMIEHDERGHEYLGPHLCAGLRQTHSFRPARGDCRQSQGH